MYPQAGRKVKKPSNSISMAELMGQGNDVAEYWMIKKHHQPNTLMLKVKERRLQENIMRFTVAQEAVRQYAVS